MADTAIVTDLVERQHHARNLDPRGSRSLLLFPFPAGADYVVGSVGSLFVCPGEITRKNRVRSLAELSAIQLGRLPPVLGIVLHDLLESIDKFRYERRRERVERVLRSSAIRDQLLDAFDPCGGHLERLARLTRLSRRLELEHERRLLVDQRRHGMSGVVHSTAEVLEELFQLQGTELSLPFQDSGPVSRHEKPVRVRRGPRRIAQVGEVIPPAGLLFCDFVLVLRVVVRVGGRVLLPLARDAAFTTTTP